MNKRQLPAPPDPPPGCVLYFAGYSNLPIYLVEEWSREGLAACSTDNWHNDPSYFWAKPGAKKR